MVDEQKRELTFLSYAHDDLDLVRKVYEGLKKRKVSVWFDNVDLVPGKWKPQIEKQITKSRYFIFCVSVASIRKTEEGTGFVDEELHTAWKIAEVQDEKKFTIVPVRLEECGHGDHRLSTFQQFDLFEDFEKGLDKLAVDIGGSSLSDTKARDERTEDEKLIDSMLGKADIAFFSGDYKRALVLAESIIELDPKNHLAWYNKGLALANSGRNIEAISAFNKATAIKPDYAPAYLNKGNALADLGKNQAAISAYDKAIELKPDDASAWYNKGVTLDDLGKNQAAISAYDKAIELKSDDISAWYNKGVTLDDLGKNQAAISAYDKAIELKPDYHVAYNNKGIALRKLGRNKEAKQAFAKAEELRKDS
jgi:tetratricopeptide (TPR) repeat protein